VLGERFHHQETERPHVRRRRDDAGGDLRRVVSAGGERGAAEFAIGVEAVHGKLQAVVDDHDVGRLQMGVDEIAGVKPGERVENGAEHLRGFGRGERPHGKNLGEHLVGVVGDGIELIFSVDVAASGMEKTHQVRVREVSGNSPLCEAGIRVHGRGRDQLDGGFAGRIAFHLGEEDTAALDSPQPSKQGESTVDEVSDAVAAEKYRTRHRIHSYLYRQVHAERKYEHAYNAEITAMGSWRYLPLRTAERRRGIILPAWILDCTTV
jgi:hypothetical protein